MPYLVTAISMRHNPDLHTPYARGVPAEVIRKLLILNRLATASRIRPPEICIPLFGLLQLLGGEVSSAAFCYT